jgi:hypothetical protein
VLDRFLKHLMLKLVRSRLGFGPPAYASWERQRLRDTANWGTVLTDRALSRAWLKPCALHVLAPTLALVGLCVFGSWGPLALLVAACLAGALYVAISAFVILSCASGVDDFPFSVLRVLGHGRVPTHVLATIPASAVSEVLAAQGDEVFRGLVGQRLYLKTRRTFDPSRLDERTREAYDVLAPGFEGTAGELLETAKTL